MSGRESGEENLATYRREAHVGILSLNRPTKRNAMNLAMWGALDAAIATAEKDQEVRVFLLRGEGMSFCAGLDLSPENELVPLITSAASASQKMEFYRVVKRVQEIHTRLERLPQPTIAVIHGHCLGAGLEIAVCCDIRLCSEGTIFGLPEARLAIITDVGGLQRLPRIVGASHAREIAFRGHRFNAERALAINLVNYVYPDKDELDSKALEMAQEIADNPPLAVQGAKDVFLFDEGTGLSKSLDYNAARSSMIVPSGDLAEAFSAYVEKRKGEFKGA